MLQFQIQQSCLLRHSTSYWQATQDSETIICWHFCYQRHKAIYWNI